MNSKEIYEVRVADEEGCSCVIIFPTGPADFAMKMEADLVMVDHNGDVFTWKKGASEWRGLDESHESGVLKIVPKSKN